MHKALALTICLTAAMVVGCMTHHELVVEPDEARCHMYGVTEADISRAMASGPKNVKALGRVVVKVLPDGTVVRLRHVATLRYREMKGQ